MSRYFDQAMETDGLYNMVCFNNDTSAFCSIPGRQGGWRRASANWLSGEVVRHIVDMEAAQDRMRTLAVGLAKRANKL